jgi:MFS family permease
MVMGIVLAIFGLAGGAVISGLLALHPAWAGPVVYVGLAICALCVVAGIALAVRERRNAQQPSTFIKGQAREIVLEGNVSSADRFADVDAQKLVARHNRHTPRSGRPSASE